MMKPLILCALFLAGYSPVTKACSYAITDAQDKPLGKIVGTSHYYDLFRSEKSVDKKVSE